VWGGGGGGGGGGVGVGAGGNSSDKTIGILHGDFGVIGGGVDVQKRDPPGKEENHSNPGKKDI